MIAWLQSLPGWVILVGCCVGIILGIVIMLCGLDSDCWDE